MTLKGSIGRFEVLHESTLPRPEKAWQLFIIDYISIINIYLL